MIVQKLAEMVVTLRAQGLHDRDGRAELPLRRQAGRPLLRDGARRDPAAIHPGRAARPTGPAARGTSASDANASQSGRQSLSTPRRLTMKLKKLSAACGAALAAATPTSARAGADLGRRDQDRLHHRHVGPVCRHRRPGRRRGDPDGDRRHGRHDQRQEDRAAGRRPPEQGRHRRDQGARMVRHRRHGHADRRHQLGHQPGDGQDRGAEEEAVHLGRRRDLGADQRPVHAVHGPLGLRHGRAGQGHRQRGRQGRRQELVLPDRRLRLRPAAAGRHLGHRQGRRRHHRRLGQAPAVGERLLVVPAAGASRARRRSWAWPMPAATPSTRSRRPTSSASPRR